MDDKLQKRISDAISDGESDNPDEELSKEIENDEDAFQFFDDVQLIEKKLRDWNHESPPREYWKSFVKRINGRLDSEDPVDEELFLAPPAPDEPEEQDAPAEAGAVETSEETSDDSADEAEEEDDGLGGLAGLAGHSTVPPLAAFDDDLPTKTSPDNDEDSGLIDLAALARAEKETAKKTLESQKSAAAAPAKDEAKGEKLATPAAPLAAAKEEKSNTGLYAVVGILILALIVVSFYALRSGDDTNGASSTGALAQAPTPATPLATEAAEVNAPPASSAVDEAANEPAEPAAEETSPEEAGDEPETASAEGMEEEGTERVAAGKNGSKARGSRREKAGRPASPEAVATPAATPAAPTPAPAPRPAAKAKTPAKGTAGDLDDLLARATGGGSAPAKQPSKAGGADPVRSAIGSPGDSAEASLPDQPSRAQVRRAMRSVSGQVMACKSLVDSMTRVNATLVVGSSGGVNSANVNGGSPAVQQCVSRAVKRARFPRFKQASFTVTYPFVLSPPQ